MDMTDSFISENIAGSYRKISKGCHSNAFFAPRNRRKGKTAEDNKTEYPPSCHTHNENRRDARHGKTIFDISLSGKQIKLQCDDTSITVEIIPQRPDNPNKSLPKSNYTYGLTDSRFTILMIIYIVNIL
jgi:hypothetical protein